MSISRSVFRGVLGGLIGGPLFLIGLTLHDFYRLGYVPYSGFFEIIPVPYMLVAGLILGSIVGCLVWVIECKAKIQLPIIGTAILGSGFVFILVSLFGVLIQDDGKWHPRSEPIEAFVDGLMFVTTLGALPAILARPKSAQPKE